MDKLLIISLYSMLMIVPRARAADDNYTVVCKVQAQFSKNNADQKMTVSIDPLNFVTSSEVLKDFESKCRAHCEQTVVEETRSPVHSPYGLDNTSGANFRCVLNYLSLGKGLKQVPSGVDRNEILELFNRNAVFKK